MEIKNFTFGLAVALLFVTGGAFATTHTVQMIDDEFVPENLTVTAGDTVMWINMGSNVHTTTSGTGCASDGMWDSGNMASGDTFVYVFDTEGNFPYFCIPHCAAGMVGEVSVGPSVGLKGPDVLSAEVYPNPVSEDLRLNLSESYQELELEIYNLSGVEFQTLEVKMVNPRQLLVNTAHLRKGVYILRLKQDEEIVLTERIQKL